MMFFGRTFQGGESVFSDWFPRGGDNAIVRTQLIAEEASAAGNLEIELFTRKSDEQGVGTMIGSTITLTSGGDEGTVQTVVQIGGFEDLVRIKVSKLSTKWMTAQVFPLVFFDSVKA